MLEDYKEFEPIIYRQMKNSLKNKLSHAYLFEMNDNIYAEDMIFSFIKSILCKEHESIDEYDNCPKCKRIDEGNYPELKKIIPEGQYIKKEQLDELQKNFSTKPLESDYRIYIIYEAEKLNSSAANSLLKFLEEPSEGIIAILLTNNSNLVLKTITSRCQILTFNKNKVEDFIKVNNINSDLTLHKLAFTLFKISDKNNIEDYHRIFIESVLKFIKYYESNGLKSIVREKDIFLDVFKEKNEISIFFECSILFYRDVINYKLNRKVMYFDDNFELLKLVSDKNTMDKILHKIGILIKKQKLLKNNINVNMLVDSLVIDMEE